MYNSKWNELFLPIKANTLYYISLYLFSAVLLFTGFYSHPKKKDLFTGSDILIRDHLSLLYGRKLGIVTNHTATLKNGIHLIDTLNSIEGIKITALFGPEHGIRGTHEAGSEIKDNVDAKTGIPVYSLYGKDKKPTKEILKNIDLLLYDIQDVGVRFYTYISTLFYLLQAAAENDIPVIVLDRPNPLNGIEVEGPVLKEELKSFVGIAPIPIRYGMTVGELAKLFSGEGYLGKNLKADLRIIKMEGWQRDSYYSDYNLAWINPSPNLPFFESSLAYPGTCLLEGTNISEGRGTERPFNIIGAPFINSEDLIKELNKVNQEGIILHPLSFIPQKIKGIAENPKYEDELCNGISIEIIDKRKFSGLIFGVKLLSVLIKLYPDLFWFNSYFDKLSGNKKLREDLLKGKSSDEIISGWQEEIEKFKQIRIKYLLY